MKSDDALMASRPTLADAVAAGEGPAGIVALTPALRGLIAQYHEHPAAEFQRLLALAKWDNGRERWRGAHDPVAYLAKVIRNEALRALKQERRTAEPLLDDQIADEGEQPLPDLDTADLDPDLVAVIQVRSNGIRWTDVADSLGWDQKRVEATRGRVRRLNPRSSGPTGTAKLYRERLNNSGRWCFSFQPSNFGVLESVISAERKNIFVTQRPKPALATLIPIRKVISMEDLTATLKTEQTRLARVSERLHGARQVSEGIERELLAARAELANEMSSAVLQDREPATDAMQKKIAKLQTTLDGKRAELAGATDAHRQQNARVEAIEAELSARYRADVINRVLPKTAQFNKLLDECAALATDIQIELSARGSLDIQASELIRTNEFEDTVMARYRMLFTLANFHSGVLPLFNPARRGELYRRYPNRMPETWAIDAA